jgi:hypothetical protein
MMYQDESSPDALVPFLLDAQAEIIDLIGRKYGQEDFGGATGEGGVPGGGPARFSRLLIRHCDDPEVRAIIEQRYRECGRILGMLSCNHSGITDFFKGLDEKSRSILMNLGEKGYATLDEMSAATNSSHFEVLYRLKEVIIPESVKVFGTPLVTFMESGTDPLTGESILFSWWLNDGVLKETGQVEVTEDDDAIMVTMELAGSDLPRSMRASATCKHGILEILVNKGGKAHERRQK